MSPLRWPTQTKRTQFLVDTLEAIGRPVEIHYVTSVSGCTICSLDPVSSTSTDAFCPVCSGAYWMENLNAQVFPAHVTWKFSEDVARYSAGKQFEGDCQVRLNYSVEMAQIVDTTRFIVVDNKVMELNKVITRGAPEVNRLILVLLEKEKEQ